MARESLPGCSSIDTWYCGLSDLGQEACGDRRKQQQGQRQQGGHDAKEYQLVIQDPVDGTAIKTVEPRLGVNLAVSIVCGMGGYLEEVVAQQRRYRQASEPRAEHR